MFSPTYVGNHWFFPRYRVNECLERKSTKCTNCNFTNRWKILRTSSIPLDTHFFPAHANNVRDPHVSLTAYTRSIPLHITLLTTHYRAHTSWGIILFKSTAIARYITHICTSITARSWLRPNVHALFTFIIVTYYVTSVRNALRYLLCKKRCCVTLFPVFHKLVFIVYQ